MATKKTTKKTTKKAVKKEPKEPSKFRPVTAGSKAESAMERVYANSMQDPKKLDEEQRRKKEEASNGVEFMPWAFSLKPGQVGLGIFLNEGTTLAMHNVQAKGEKAPKWALCLKAIDEEAHCVHCANGVSVSQRTIFMLIHTNNTYRDKKTGGVRTRPVLKMFNRGREDARTFADARISKNQGRGTLVHKLWEISREGEGLNTRYAIDVENKGKAVDVAKMFAKIVEVETREGLQRLPEIRQPEWPKVIPGSFYESFEWKPKKKMDWTNPKAVHYWIMAWAMNSPPSLYADRAQELPFDESDDSEIYDMQW